MKRVLWILIFVAAGILGHEAANMKYQLNATLSLMDRDSEMDLSEVDVSEDTLLSEDKIVNILLVGADKRAYWSQKGRSDSVMIATIDMKHKELKLTSLMRDMYVEIPGYQNAKFNAAYSYGGISLLYQTIAQNFGIKLDGYVIVDFEAFKNVINTIGGVDVELTQAECDYLLKTYAGKKTSILKLQPGLNKMNGTQALAYTRIRQDARGDFGRTQRQRNVLNAIFQEAKSMSLSELKGLAEGVLPCVVTDVTNDEVVSYLMSVIMMGTTDIEQLRIPIDNGYTQDRINGQAVLVVDWDVNRQALQDFIFQSSKESN
ncbi:MAG: polyisoprenyl-teichoic acid--peptidoglycan teichoic acid transferase [Clostridiales bacterium]|nr:polyisoprenyl-teichoic acid--peptidoglycan teichoic acid transferase [Clostridiales bacterium]